MSVKYFCDVCGCELSRNLVDDRLRASVGRVSFEIMAGVDGTWNDGHLCPTCVRSAVVQSLDNAIAKAAKKARRK